MNKIFNKAQQEKIKEIADREHKLLKQLSELAEKKIQMKMQQKNIICEKT